MFKSISGAVCAPVLPVLNPQSWCCVHGLRLGPVALALALALSLPPVVALAQTPPADASPVDPAALTLGEVSVSAPRSGPLSSRRLSTSVDVLGAEILATKVVDQSWELFKQVPGVMLTEFKQGTTSGKLSFRGFNGEGNVNGVKLLIDGLPANSNDGNMPYLDMVSPLEISRIEVVRGTNDPRWGLHNIAGHAQVFTRQGGDEGLARLTFGSFGTAEAQLAKGLSNEQGFEQNYFIGLRSSEGYRAHSEQSKANLAGKWFYQPSGQAWRAGLTARAYAAKAQEAGYLTQAQVEADPTQSPSHNASDEDSRRMSQWGLHVEGEAAMGLSWVAKAYRNRLDDRRYVKFSASASQQERIVRETHLGALGSLTWRASPQFQLEGGLQREWQDNTSERYLTVNQVRGSQTRNQVFSFDTTGAYVQAVISPHKQWTILPAYRIDRVGGQLLDVRTGLGYPVNDFGLIRQPKLSVVFAPDAQHSLYANGGRSFQVGVGAASFRGASSTGDIPASINEGWELGWKFRPSAGWLEGRMASWQQKATNEIYRQLGSPTNDATNLGSTLRRGVDLQVNVRPSATLSAWTSLTLQRATIDRALASAPATQGKEVDHVPHFLHATGVRWQAAPAWSLSASVRTQSAYYIENTNTQGRHGDFAVVDLGAAYQAGERVSIDLQIKNLLDSRHQYVWWDEAQSLHAPADGRAAYVSANLRF